MDQSGRPAGNWRRHGDGGRSLTPPSAGASRQWQVLEQAVSSLPLCVQELSYIWLWQYGIVDRCGAQRHKQACTRHGMGSRRARGDDEISWRPPCGWRLAGRPFACQHAPPAVKIPAPRRPYGPILAGICPAACATSRTHHAQPAAHLLLLVRVAVSFSSPAVPYCLCDGENNYLRY
jgi:hypothetical protein